MPDNDNSLGDERTLLGANAGQENPQSLGDRSTLGGGDGSSVSDLGSIGDLPDHDMEIVDLSKRYRIERSLGKGGMGEVLLATDTRLDRQVAIKRIRADVAVGRTATARFLTEAKAVAALSHNNVVGVYDFGRDEQGPFLIMEYVSGGSLLQRCKQGPIELEEAIELACQLCDGLGRAHDAGIIHRDIKPANILLTADGIPKLTDFGLAKADSRDHTMTMAGAVLGTLDFMPPEQRQDAALTDSRSDLWSLAATIYQMVTGESPKVIRLKKVPQQLRDVLDRGLEEAKEERFQTASDFKNALAQSLRGDVSNATELEQGECPSCGTKNESQRKFCRNTQCAASLEAACLSCETPIPLWEGVCGQCGSIQADLVQQRIDEMKDLQAEAGKLLVSAEYTKASQIADGIREQTDPRLQQFRSWAEGFADEVETSKQEQIHKINAAITEADAHEKAYDYAAGIKSLQQIPKPIYTRGELEEIEPAREILVRLQSKYSRSSELDNEIKAAVQSRELEGLRSKVESLLELLPDRADLLKLQKQLAEREEKLQRQRSTAIESAREMLEKQDYESGISILSKIKPEVVNEEVSTLLTELESKQELLLKLRSQIDTHLKGNTRDTDYLPLLNQYLELDSDNSQLSGEQVSYKRCVLGFLGGENWFGRFNELMQKNENIDREELESWKLKVEELLESTEIANLLPNLKIAIEDQRNVANLILDALNFRSSCCFSEAVMYLDRIPSSYKSFAVTRLRSECQTLCDLQSQALSKMASARSLADFHSAYDLVCDYGDSMNATSLKDEGVEQAFIEFNERLKTAEQRKDRKEWGVVLGSFIFFFVILLAACAGLV